MYSLNDCLQIMEMTKQELMIQRWKCISNFPGNTYYVGEVFTLPLNCDKQQMVLSNGVDEIDIDIDPLDYPSIFERLEWWEEREEKDLPEYVRYKGCSFLRLGYPSVGEVIKVDNYQDDCLNSGDMCDWITLYEPATQQEYLNQNERNRM